jgi:hypothetical protein
MGDLPYEEFWMLLLNKANRILKKFRVSEGGISGTVVDPKKIFKIGLDLHASSLILGHNIHPGTSNPAELVPGSPRKSKIEVKSLISLSWITSLSGMTGTIPLRMRVLYSLKTPETKAIVSGVFLLINGTTGEICG